MKMKPILFNTDMVRAILEGRKTVTRRVVKPHYRDNEIGFNIIKNANTGKYVCIEYFDEWENKTRYMADPYRPGDILYVRETWAPFYETMYSDPVIGYRYYSETDEEIKERIPEYLNWFWPGRWHPSIHMPREAARIFLRVTDVRVERLQEITEEQGILEGFEAYHSDSGYYEPATLGFVETWDSTIKKTDHALYGWDANPWVWVIEFERITREEALSHA